jgi:hypothetical protein
VYSPDPDVRLVRNIWTKGDVGERVSKMLHLCGEYLHVMNYYSRDLDWESR